MTQLLLFILVFFISIPAYSQEVKISVNDASKQKQLAFKDKDKDNKTWVKKDKSQCPTYQVIPFDISTMARPNLFPQGRDLTEAEAAEVKDALSNQGLANDADQKWQEGRKLIHVGLTPAKDDYVNDYDRGTVLYSSAVHNYSYHKVKFTDGIVIDGTQKGYNFTQDKQNTTISNAQNLTFINCNLRNVSIKPSWTVTSCNTYQGGLVHE